MTKQDKEALEDWALTFLEQTNCDVFEYERLSNSMRKITLWRNKMVVHRYRIPRDQVMPDDRHLDAAGWNAAQIRTLRLILMSCHARGEYLEVRKDDYGTED